MRLRLAPCVGQVRPGRGVQGEPDDTACRELIWKILVAAQPPPSAPTIPITRVRMRPRCPLPGISILAIRPAARPGTIHVINTHKDSKTSDQMSYAVITHAEQSAAGGKVSPGSGVLQPQCRARTGPCTGEKNPGPCCRHRVIPRMLLPGSGALLTIRFPRSLA